MQFIFHFKRILQRPSFPISLFFQDKHLANHFPFQAHLARISMLTCFNILFCLALGWCNMYCAFAVRQAMGVGAGQGGASWQLVTLVTMMQNVLCFCCASGDGDVGRILQRHSFSISSASCNHTHFKFCIRFGSQLFFPKSSVQTCQYLYRLHWRHSRGYVFTRLNSVGVATSVEETSLFIGARKELWSLNSETAPDFELLAVFASPFSFMYKSFALDKQRCVVEERHSFPISSAETLIFILFCLGCHFPFREAFILQRHSFFNFKRRDIHFAEALISMIFAEALVSINLAEAFISSILSQRHSFCRGTHFHQFN